MLIARHGQTSRFGTEQSLVSCRHVTHTPARSPDTHTLPSQLRVPQHWSVRASTLAEHVRSRPQPGTSTPSALLTCAHGPAFLPAAPADALFEHASRSSRLLLQPARSLRTTHLPMLSVSVIHYRQRESMRKERLGNDRQRSCLKVDERSCGSSPRQDENAKCPSPPQCVPHTPYRISYPICASTSLNSVSSRLPVKSSGVPSDDSSHPLPVLSLSICKSDRSALGNAL
eukprot:3339946-Rhodomonas_salina.2